MKKQIIWLIISVFLIACNGEEAAPTTLPTSPPEATNTLPPPTELPPTATTVPTMEPTATAIPEAAVSAETPGTLLYISHYGGGPALTWEKQNLEAYQALRPNLEVTHLENNYYNAFVNTVIHEEITGDSLPDVMSGLIVGVLREYVEAGLIADISDLWQAEGWDTHFPPSLKEMVTFDGKQYFVPMAIQWNSIFYRQTVFDELGLIPPTTWEALLTTCDTLQEAGITPFTISVSQWPPPMGFWFTHINMRLNGPDFHEGLMRGEEHYDDPRVRAVFEHWQQLFDHNCFADDAHLNNYQSGISDFSSGEAAMYNHGEWLFEFLSPEVAEDTATFAFPVINPEITAVGELVPMYGAFMLADAPNPDEARAFLAYLGGLDSQLSNFEALGRVASHLQVERGLYDTVHEQGLTIVENADYVTQLYGANTDPVVANAGYTAMGRFWRTPENLDAILADWEAARTAVYGE